MNMWGELLQTNTSHHIIFHEPKQLFRGGLINSTKVRLTRIFCAVCRINTPEQLLSVLTATLLTQSHERYGPIHDHISPTAANPDLEKAPQIIN